MSISYGLPSTDIASLLLTCPVGTRVVVSDVARAGRSGPLPVPFLPQLEFECAECDRPALCTGQAPQSGSLFPGLPVKRDYLYHYNCMTCGRLTKAYGIRFVAEPEKGPGAFYYVEVIKMGEWPAFAPRTPARLISLVGPDRDLYLKGRRAEIEGLGVGAFAYYRRIVEDQKNRLLDEIIRVAGRTNAPNEMIAKLQAAKNETQFSRAVDSVKDAVPQVLYIKGHNPLTLLHSALSQKLHGATDAECLESAHTIRLVLGEFAERMGQVLKDEKELDDAISRLANRGNTK